MRIEWVTACGEIGRNERGELVLVTPGAETSPVDEFPCENAFVTVAVSMLAAYDETNDVDVHALTWTVVGPAGDELLQDTMRFRLGERSAWHHVGWNGRMIEPIVLRFTAPSEGAYTLTFRVDGGEPFILPHYFATLMGLL